MINATLHGKEGKRHLGDRCASVVSLPRGEARNRLLLTVTYYSLERTVRCSLATISKTSTSKHAAAADHRSTSTTSWS